MTETLIALAIAACVLLGISLLLKVAQIYAKGLYQQWLRNPSTPLDVDAFVDTAKNPPKYLKIAFLQRMSVGYRKVSMERVKLASAESPHFPNIQVTERATQRPNSKFFPSPKAMSCFDSCGRSWCSEEVHCSVRKVSFDTC